MRAKSFEEIGRNAWLSGTSIEHFTKYLFSRGISLGFNEVGMLEVGFFLCQSNLIIAGSEDTLLNNFLKQRKANRNV